MYNHGPHCSYFETCLWVPAHTKAKEQTAPTNIPVPAACWFLLLQGRQTSFTRPFGATADEVLAYHWSQSDTNKPGLMWNCHSGWPRLRGMICFCHSVPWGPRGLAVVSHAVPVALGRSTMESGKKSKRSQKQPKWSCWSLLALLLYVEQTLLVSVLFLVMESIIFSFLLLK